MRPSAASLNALHLLLSHHATPVLCVFPVLHALTHTHNTCRQFNALHPKPKTNQAACTPEFYVFDQSLKLTYHGQYDDARPNSNKLVTGVGLVFMLT